MKNSTLFEAISALSTGEIVVYPTDTQYGLAADIYNDKAVRKIYNLKKRPFNVPLSIAVSNVSNIGEIAFLNDKSLKIAKRLLPGKLTLLLNKKSRVSDLISSGKKKVAVRIPDNNICLKLLDRFGPLTCTSANLHGQITPSLIKDIKFLFKDQVSVYIDDGKKSGMPSTIVDATNEDIVIIREGAIDKNQIMDAINNG